MTEDSQRSSDIVDHDRWLRLLPVHLILRVITTCYNQASARYNSEIRVNTCQLLKVLHVYLVHPLVADGWTHKLIEISLQVYGWTVLNVMELL